MKRWGIGLIAALLVGNMLSGCGDSKKEVTNEEVKMALEKELTRNKEVFYGFVIKNVEIKATEHKGGEIDPTVLTRFYAEVNLKENLYLSRKKYIMGSRVVYETFNKKTPIMIYGITESKLEAEKWSTSVSDITSVKSKPKGKALSSFSRKYVIEGSNEEKKLIAKRDNLKAEKEAKEKSEAEERKKIWEARKAENEKKQKIIDVKIKKNTELAEGTWEGMNYCGIREKPIKLELVSNGITLNGIFTYKLPNRKGGWREGSYKVSGKIDENKNITLKPGEWIQKAKTYRKYELSGAIDASDKIMAGKKTAYGCKEFRLEKISSGQ